jgi:hypothetical protein
MIFRMAEQNISQTSFSRPEIAVAEGLLIVSLAPSRLSEKSLVLIDPYQAGALALEVTKRLGLDDSMYVVPREIGGATLDQWDTSAALNRLCLVSPTDKGVITRVRLTMLLVLSNSGLAHCTDRRGELLDASFHPPRAPLIFMGWLAGSTSSPVLAPCSTTSL